MAGQIAPITAGAGTVSNPYAEYSPTIVELLIFAGAGALMAFVYTLAERYLDLEESDDHVFFNWPWIKPHARNDEAAHADPADAVGGSAGATPEGTAA
jgi:hypothetical protein